MRKDRYLCLECYKEEHFFSPANLEYVMSAEKYICDKCNEEKHIVVLTHEKKQILL